MEKISEECTNGIKINRVWFCEDIKNIHVTGDVIFVYGYKKKISKYKYSMQHSTFLDLTLSKDELFISIKKNVRYEINRSIKENVEMKIFSSEDLKKSSDELLNFEKKYNQMYIEKGIKNKLNMKTVKGYIDNNMFLLTKAIKEGRDLCYHAYVVNGEKTRLLYSCSNFRNDDKETRNLIARANKFLHWEDINFFKSHGYFFYDFGGISSFNNPNGIDKFKISFGGKRVEYYNMIYGRTFKGKLCVLLRNIVRKK